MHRILIIIIGRQEHQLKLIEVDAAVMIYVMLLDGFIDLILAHLATQLAHSFLNILPR